MHPFVHKRDLWLQPPPETLLWHRTVKISPFPGKKVLWHGILEKKENLLSSLGFFACKSNSGSPDIATVVWALRNGNSVLLFLFFYGATFPHEIDVCCYVCLYRQPSTVSLVHDEDIRMNETSHLLILQPRLNKTTQIMNLGLTPVEARVTSL